MRRCVLTPSWLLAAVLALSACGGGGGDEPTAAPAGVAPPAAGAASPAAAAPPPAPEATVPDAGTLGADTAEVGDAQRIGAASATAKSVFNACAGVRPFYWEIGNRAGKLVWGSVDAGAGGARYTATTPMAVASASKWLYAAYFVQRQGGQLTERDRRFLSLRSGYVNYGGCSAARTVDGCLAEKGNDTYSPEMDGRFYYDGGHVEKHASVNGLGGLDNPGLAAELRSQLGADLALEFVQPRLAAGVSTTPDAYGRVLRKMLDGQLLIGALLGSGAVCTNPLTCGAQQAVYAPVRAGESWHYSVGHWVEDDPEVGDGAFSSPGAYGFYPWINARKTTYGLLARVAENGGWASAQCGRLIRKAWATGVAQ